MSDDPGDQGRGPGRPPARGAVVAFRRRPRDLGLGAMAKLLGAPREQTTGHWCSRCQGIWYGYLLEVACPVCGNRHG